LGTGIAGAPTGAASAPPVAPGAVPVINLATAGTGIFNGTLTFPLLPNGIAPAIVMAAGGTGGLIAKILVRLADGSQAIVTNVPHVSTVPAGPCWSWPQQAVWPGANS
jgi:hypothetical protein